MAASIDVLVIGGGVAGIAAALTARAAGAAVAVARSAPGATAVSSGAWRGPMPAVVGAALEAGGLPYVPAPQPLPHPFGDLRACDFAAESHAGALAVEGGFLCGIAGLGGFAAPILARLYATSARPAARAGVIELAGTPRDGWAPAALAAAIERDPSIVADPLRLALPPDASHVVLPAVLGLAHGRRVRADIAAAIGIPVFETLGTPPSIPGLRLDRALLAGARAAGIDVIVGAVRADGIRDGRITGVRIEAADGSAVDATSGASGGSAAQGSSAAEGARSLMASHYVLASGKFFGGGIAAGGERRLTETAFGLPVWIEHLDQTFASADSLTLTSRVRTYDQPLMKAGVHVNDALRPVDARTRVVLSNVTVAGAVRAGTDTASLGLGHAAAQGVAAATALERVA